MPAIVGPIQVVSISGGNIQFGDTFVVSPKSATKSVAGSGSANTGIFIITNNGISANNILDTNLVDQPILGNL
ncbi:spore germination protein [Peribacillus alkalitolerans]|uniref:spore germination protein n=1 Tax=Peribacillus alkalitolerans TaxID=1550385 RepID=UPI0013D4DCC5|nr:spore germination protein [Peribacillus alkalitolerans]